MKVRTTKETIAKVGKVVKDALAERSKHDFFFDPIIVEPWFLTDEEYLQVFTVCEADFDAWILLGPVNWDT